MHSQEPWQSRSPTGSVNKPLNSSTLKKKGHKGPHHSYGRGLPVKRKALIILSIAILAFAMIPALGAGAAAGDVKIVTPDELANPSGKGSAFDKLTATQFVSDKTGTVDTLEDAGGTLYVVIEDNDATANPLIEYVVYFDDPGHSGAQGGDAFVIEIPATGPIVGNALNSAALGDGKGNPVDLDEDGFVRDAVAFADANRDGQIDDDDIIVETGTYTAAATDDPQTDADESKIGFSGGSMCVEHLHWPVRGPQDNQAGWKSNTEGRRSHTILLCSCE